MTNTSIRPEDILADEANTTEVNGVKMRKGTVAAVLANANILESSTSSEQQKQDALQTIKELAPALVALGLNTHVTWKNKQIQKILDEVVI